MNTKEAIRFINDLEIYLHDDYLEFKEYKEAFFKLLKQGEKYKKMWEELYEIASEFNFFPLMGKLEQKYLKEE